MARGRNYVQATARTLELTRVGHAVNFKIYRQGRLLGRLAIGLGALRWIPPGKDPKETKTIPWKVFATMIREWPFGDQVGARLKFQRVQRRGKKTRAGDSYLRWRSPGKKGAGRKMSWAEFVERMEAPLSSAAKKRIAAATK